VILYSNVPTITDGNVQKVLVDDFNGSVLLSDILKEMKKMNLHMSIVNDMSIENTEVEV